jgi:hypothetical protein
MKMDGIDDFAARVVEEFCRSQQIAGDRFNLGISNDAVEDLIKAVFYASLIPDEGRHPEVCLMCYRTGSQLGFHFLLNHALTPTPEHIAKLAHAVAPGSHISCICDQGGIRLGGIHVTVLNEMREFGYSSYRVANPLKLRIRGPGHIETSTGGLALIYKAGEITEENVFHDSSVMRALAAAVESELADLTAGTVEALDSIFNDLAKAIVRLGHGGILLFAKDPKKTQFSSLKQIDCLFLQQLLTRYWDDVAACVAASGGVGNLLNDAQRRVTNPHVLAVASDTAMLEKCIESIAHLAGMDGAILLNYACNVTAFNAIIVRSSGGAEPRLVDPHGHSLRCEEVVGRRGSRHQSALSYAMNVPNSFALVISQDGGISAFHNPDDGTVVCELGMRVLD